MKLFKNIIRGGQTNIHQLRMIRQILWIGFISSLICSLTYGVYLAHERIPRWAWSQWIDLKKAELKVKLLSKEEAAESFQDIRRPFGITQRVSILSIVRDPGVLDTQRRLYYEGSHILRAVGYLLLKIYIGLLMLWYVKGYLTRRDKFLRGGTLISPRKLKWLIRRKRKASFLKIDGLPLIRGKETSHILITGTTGSGKSNCLNKLIPQTRSRGQKGVVVDLSGDFVEKHYDPEKDILLNPFDERTSHWSPWADCLNQTHYDAFAAALIPAGFKSDPFWDNAARTILSAVLEKLKEEGRDKVSELCNLLLAQTTRTVERYLKGTRAANMASADSDKTTASILSNLGTHLKSFVYIEDASREAFSIRKWIEDEGETYHPDGWLFLTASPDQRETLRPLITVWMDIVISGLMSLTPSRARRLWMIIDELPGLQKLPSLSTGLAESRKYGGCIIGGIQSLSQMNDIYGHNQAASLLDNFNTKVFFRAMNPDTARWVSRVIGTYEQKEVNENLSYGSNTMRDGVSLSNLEKSRQLVTEGEVMALADLEAYIKLPEDMPVTKLKMKIERIESRNKAFHMRDVQPHRLKTIERSFGRERDRNKGAIHLKEES